LARRRPRSTRRGRAVDRRRSRRRRRPRRPCPDGLTIAQLYKTFKVRWTDLGRFGVADIDGCRRVVFLYDSAYRRGLNDRRFAVVLKGFEAALPGNYGKPPDKLAAMLNHYMERYKGQASR
jgi:hypothetical protein